MTNLLIARIFLEKLSVFKMSQMNIPFPHRYWGIKKSRVQNGEGIKMPINERNPEGKYLQDQLQYSPSL